MANIVIKVKTDGGEESLKNINDLKKAISELDAASEKLDFGSEAFEKSKTQADELKRKLESLSKSQKQLDEDINNAAEEASSKRAERMEKVGNNLQKFAAGLTDAFAGAFIAMGASGKDAEEMNKTLQQGVGVAVGAKGAIEALVAGVELAGPAFEALNVIMMANPIGAIIVAVAALAAGIYFLNEAINAEETESEKLNKQLEEQVIKNDQLRESNKNLLSVQEAKISLMVAEGKSIKEIREQEEIAYKIKRDTLSLNIEDLVLTQRRNFAALQEKIANDGLIEAYYKKAAAMAESLGMSEKAETLRKLGAIQEAKDAGEALETFKKGQVEIETIKTEMSVLDLGRQTQIANDRKTDVEANKKANVDKSKSDDERIAKEWAQHLKDNADAADRLKGEEEDYAVLAELDKKALESEIEISGRAVKNKKDEEARKLDASLLTYNEQKKARDDAEKAEELARQNLIKKLDAINKYTQAIGGLANQVMGVFSAISEMQKQTAEQDSKDRQAKLDVDISNLEAAKELELNKEGTTNEQKVAIANKYAAIEYKMKLDEYNKNTEVKKKIFEQDKKLKIAQTIISTITGTVAAITGTISALGGGPWAIAAGALAGLEVAAMGAIQIAAISKQKFDAGTPPPAPTITAPSSSAPGSDSGTQQGPQLYDIGKGDVNTGNVMRQGQGNNEPIRAYVISQEVTSSQNMNAVIERRSSF